MSRTPHLFPSRNAPYWAAAALLAAFLALAWRTAMETGPTYDEPAHLVDGYIAWQAGDFSLNAEHPPLTKLWAALPLQFVKGLPDVRNITGLEGAGAWTVARALLFSHGAPMNDRIMHLARRQMLLFAVGLGLAIFLLSRELWGPWGGVFSLSLYSFCPNWIAHAGIVHTDVAASFGFVLIAWLLVRRRRRAGWRDDIWLGLALGVAMVSKFNAIFALPVVLLVLAAMPARGGGRERNEEETPLPPLAGGQKSLSPLAGAEAATHFDLRGEILGRIGHIEIVLLVAWACTVLVYGWPPDLRAYIRGMMRVNWNHIPNYPVYFWGRRWPGGVWFYFLGAMLVKIPTATLAAFAAGLFCLRRSTLDRAACALAPAAYLAFWIMLLADNLGVRYVFPAYAFLLVFAGILLDGGLPRWRWRAGLAGALTACLSVAAAGSVPDGMAFFNVFAGGPRGGIRYLDDSNLDWGQALPQVLRYIETHPKERCVISWYAPIGPAEYGAKAVDLSSCPDQVVMPADSTYLITANALAPPGAHFLPGLTLDWLERYRPAQVLGGGAVYVYKFAYTNGMEKERFDEETGTNRIDQTATLREGIERLTSDSTRYDSPALKSLAEKGVQRLRALRRR